MIPEKKITFSYFYFYELFDLADISDIFMRLSIGDIVMLLKKPFTLNEILAVLAVLSIMAVLVIPLFKDISASARESACRDSLIELVRANFLYEKTYDAFVPASASVSERWYGARLLNDGNFSRENGPLAEFFKRSGFPAPCPLLSDFTDDGGRIYSGDNGGSGYGYNENIGSLRCVNAEFDNWEKACRASGISKSDIVKPSGTVMFTDTISRFNSSGLPDVDGFYVEFAFARSFDTFNKGKPSWGTPEPTVHFRHRLKTSVVWADGHTSMEDARYTKDSWGLSHCAFLGSPDKNFFTPLK